MHGVNPLRVDDSTLGIFRATLDAEMKGTTIKQVEPITPNEEALLW